MSRQDHLLSLADPQVIQHARAHDCTSHLAFQTHANGMENGTLRILPRLKGSFAPHSASCASASASSCAVRTALTAMRSSLDSRSAPPLSLYSLLPCATCRPEPAQHAAKL